MSMMPTRSTCAASISAVSIPAPARSASGGGTKGSGSSSRSWFVSIRLGARTCVERGAPNLRRFSGRCSHSTTQERARGMA
eukprot:scaffold16868_cov60-Phaeocystis_antarctica.AAC.3